MTAAPTNRFASKLAQSALQFRRAKPEILQINLGKLCNLTILLELGYDGLAEVLAENEVEIVASMPCYSSENVNGQRGEGVFDASITALRRLNAIGYEIDPKLPLNLVYDPSGGFLPGRQAELEADYKREFSEHFGIVFDRLYTITNMPVSRFASWLRKRGQYEEVHCGRRIELRRFAGCVRFSQ